MFWIGMLVGVIVSIVVFVAIVIRGLKFFGVNLKEMCDITEALEGVGNRREAEIKVTTDMGTAFEFESTVLLEKE